MSGGITAGTGMAIMGGALLGGAILSSQASKSAAQTQANAANQSTAANTAALNKQIELNQPFVNAGYTATNALSTQAPFNPNAFNYQADPGYAFRLKEGNNALNASAAARGGLISGNALKAATNYGQAAGSQEYQNAYNRYVQGYGINTSNNQFLANLGQNSANNTGAAIGNTAASNSANIIGAGNANAAGQVGSANAYTNAIGQGIGAYQSNSLMNLLANRNTSAYSTPTTLTPGADAILQG
jgi:hypothetical protein